MKSNLERHLCHDKTFGAAFNKESSTYQKICFAIALFHSSVNERRGYSLCGWNQGLDDSKLSYLLLRPERTLHSLNVLLHFFPLDREVSRPIRTTYSPVPTLTWASNNWV